VNAQVIIDVIDVMICSLQSDGNAVQYQACFCADKLHIFLGKSTKTAATRAALFYSSMHQIVCRSPDPLTVFRGLLQKKGEGRRR